MSSLAAIGALYYTGQQSGATQAQIVQAEQGQVTSRYTAAVEQLGDDALEVRLGGIYALERLAHDSPRDQSTVTEVLSAYLRSKLPAAGSPECTARPAPSPPALAQPLPGDLNAALTVLGRRNPLVDGVAPDLENVCLRSSSLPSSLDLREGNLAGADLSGSNAYNLDVSRADLSRTSLARIQLLSCTFSQAYLADADLSEANVTATLLNDAIMVRARLSRAKFFGVNLSGAKLYGADVDAAEFWSRTVQIGELRRSIGTDVSDLRGTTGRPSFIEGR